MKTNIKPYVRQFYRGNKRYLALAVVQTSLLTAANLLISWLMQQIIDKVGGKEIAFSFAELVLLAAVSIGLILLTFAFAYISRPRFFAKAMAQYKEHVYAELSKKSIAAFSGENTAVYISALSNDAGVIERSYLNSIFTILDQSVLCVGALLLMCWYSPLLTLISVAFALLPLLASVLTGNLVASAEEQVSSKNETYMSMLRDSLVGFSLIKAFRAEKRMIGIFARAVKDVSSAQEKKQKMLILVECCSTAAGATLQLGVFLVGAYLAISGSALSAGSVLVFVQLLNYVLSPIGAIPQALAERKAAKALIKKLADALSENVRTEGSVRKTALAQGITVEDLSFAYEESKPILQNVNFHFEAGKSYCLVGASGSGKTTLINLLMASHANYTGSIRYDESEVTEIAGESLYELVSQVQQNVFIFNASIRDNMTMFADFPKEAVDRAIDLAGLRTLLDERGESYLCGENGSGLSGGEKQRIAIARALLKNAQVLLVDEATSALDQQTAAQVIDAILSLDGLTRIVITHALEEKQLRRYDGILALKGGAIIESGSFDELMDRKGYFYSLYTVSQ